MTDIYADILTHIEAEGFRCAPLLEELCSVPTMDNWRELYTGLRVEIMKQRQQKVDAWSPSYVLTPVPALMLFFLWLLFYLLTLNTDSRSRRHAN